MTITKTLTLESNGKTIEIKIERTKGLVDNIAYADGWNVNLGKKTVDATYIRVFVDGKCKTISYSAPHIITKDSYRESYDMLKAKGVYARVGDMYLTEVFYNKIMDLIAEIDSELEVTQEFIDVKAKEDAKKAAEIAREEKAAAEYARAIKNGMCPKCGTWCYGDCEAN